MEDELDEWVANRSVRGNQREPECCWNRFWHEKGETPPGEKFSIAPPTENQLAEQRASEEALARLGPQDAQRNWASTGWARLARAVNCPQREPLDATPRQFEKENAWGLGWRVGFYTAVREEEPAGPKVHPEDVAIKCPFEDVGLARAWSAGLLAGEAARESYQAEFGELYPNALEIGNKPFMTPEQVAAKRERAAAKRAIPAEIARAS